MKPQDISDETLARFAKARERVRRAVELSPKLESYEQAIAQRDRIRAERRRREEEARKIKEQEELNQFIIERDIKRKERKLKASNENH